MIDVFNRIEVAKTENLADLRTLTGSVMVLSNVFMLRTIPLLLALNQKYQNSALPELIQVYSEDLQQEIMSEAFIKPDGSSYLNKVKYWYTQNNILTNPQNVKGLPNHQGPRKVFDVPHFYRINKVLNILLHTADANEVIVTLNQIATVTSGSEKQLRTVNSLEDIVALLVLFSEQLVDLSEEYFADKDKLLRVAEICENFGLITRVPVQDTDRNQNRRWESALRNAINDFLPTLPPANRLRYVKGEIDYPEIVYTNAENLFMHTLPGSKVERNTESATYLTAKFSITNKGSSLINFFANFLESYKSENSVILSEADLHALYALANASLES